MKIKKDDVEKKVLDFVQFLNNTDFETKTRIFYQAEKLGYHIMKTRFYSPIPITFELNENQFQNIYSNIDFNDDLQLELLSKFKQFSNEFVDLKNEGLVIDQNPFSLHDAPFITPLLDILSLKKFLRLELVFQHGLLFMLLKKTPILKLLQ